MSYLQRLREKHKHQQRQTVQAPQEAPAQRETTTQQEACKAEPEYDPYSHQACGMIQCKNCKHWNYSQCRNKGYGSADPEQWRRCKGYECL